MLIPRLLRTVLLVVVPLACRSATGDGPTNPQPGTPPVGDGANLRLASVQFTQNIQDADSALPLISGQPVAVNVLIARSKESTDEVPVVLRLFRNGVMIRSDTTRSAGVLGPSVSDVTPSAQFLIASSLVNGTGTLSWQVEIDPARSVGDSTRTDNLLPATIPGLLNIISVAPIPVRVVSIVLGNHGGVAGEVTSANIDRYLQTVRQTLPVGSVVAGIAPPLTTMADFGETPNGAGLNFWTRVLQEVDIARLLSQQPNAYWFGAVSPPTGYTKYTFGGYGYIPNIPSAAGAGTRSSVGFGIGPNVNAAFVSKTLAHELGHNLGRLHAPSCAAGSPVDAQFPDAQGTILSTGHDVWSWAAGLTRGALSVSRATGDVMGYCGSVWASAYTWRGIMQWRQASPPIIAQVQREPAIIVVGTVAADGTVSLRPALEADAAIPATDDAGDMDIELRTASGSVLGRQRVASARVDHGDGARHFVAVLPAVAGTSAQVLSATSRTSGRAAQLRATDGDVTLQVRQLAGNRTEVTAPDGRAVMLRDAATGELLSIGWNGRAVVSHRGAIRATVSNGVRSRSDVIQLR